MRIYEKWPNEEDFIGLKLQWDVKYRVGECIHVKFQVIKWHSQDGETSESWDENTVVDVLCDGDIYQDGVRHLFFGYERNGYLYYPDLKLLTKCLERVNELCKEWGIDNER